MTEGAPYIGIDPAKNVNVEVEIAAQRDPRRTVATLGPWLGDRNARPILVEAIGAIGADDGLRWLAPLVGDPSLSEDEAIRLACALGEIGGDEGRALLEDLRESTPDAWQAVKAEIDLACEAIATTSA